MPKLFLTVLIPLALAAGGCDRKPTDPPKPKTGAMQPAAPTSGLPGEPKGPHLVRI
jgi:hypothetical protein